MPETTKLNQGKRHRLFLNFGTKIDPILADSVIFLDETGTTDYFDGPTLHRQQSLIASGRKPDRSLVFGLGGVLMKAADYKDFHNGLNAIKTTHFGHSGFSLHEYDIRKMKTPPFPALRDNLVWQAFKSDLELLLLLTPFLVIVATIDKVLMQETYDKPFHPYQYCLHVILERVVNEKSYGTKCLVVAEDRAVGVNQELTQELLRLQVGGGAIGPSPTVHAEEFLRRIHSTILFGKKTDLIAGLELADLCAGPVTRWLHNLGKPGAREVIDLVRPRLRRSPSGIVRGWGAKCLPNFPAACPLT